MKIKKILSLPYYPFLLFIYFFLHFYATNVAQRPVLSGLLPPLGISLIVTAVLLFSLNLFFKNKNRAALLTSILIFLFLSYGHIHGVLSKFFSFRQEILLGIFALIIISSFWFIIKKTGSLDKITHFLNLMTIFLCLMPIWNIAVFHITSVKTPAAISLKKEQNTIKNPNAINLPDIYYIILDEYAREDTLRNVYGYDNSDFINFLKSKGFYIAENSHANYFRTTLSLPSSLNMQYLTFLTKVLGPNTNDTKIPYAMVRGNNVARKLKAVGYKYALIHSGSPPTDYSELADIYIEYGIVDELASVLAKGTLLKKAASDFMHEQSRKRHLYNFKELKKIPEIEGPTFTFAHILLPHSPFVFDREGNPASTESFSLTTQEYGDAYPKLYIDQLIHCNTMMKDLINEILKKSPRPPIIIIQADHGNTPEGEWEETGEFIQQRSKILNAYYFPGPAKKALYPTISPVNTFRLIFKEYFGANLDLLEDKVYYSHPENSPYVFKEVTDILFKDNEKSKNRI